MAQRPVTPKATESDQRKAPPAEADFTALVSAHHATAYRYACRLCGCPTEAEDLTQQAFLIAQQKIDQLRDVQRAGGWLLAIVRSCFLKSRRKSRPTPAQDIDLQVDQIPDQTPDVEPIDREQLAAALAELPDEFRLVLLMFYFEELSYQEIAQQLEVPIGTVMSRLSRAKGHLRSRLEKTDSNGTPPHVSHRNFSQNGPAGALGLPAARYQS